MRPTRDYAIPVLVLVLAAGCDSGEHAITATAPSADLSARSVVTDAGLGQPLEGLTLAQGGQFRRGAAVFNRVFTPQTGLGPLFNAASCATCHAGGGAGVQIETHGTVYHADGTCDLLESVGGQVFQNFATPQLTAATGLTKEPIPSYASLGHRTTPQLFGRGLLEAISDSTIKALAERERRTDPQAAGRVAILPDGSVGRFGRKDNAPTLGDFNADAFLYEMGITTPTGDSVDGPIGPFPVPPGVDLAKDPELSLADLDATTNFVRYLAPPRRDWRRDADANYTFHRVGCATCHVTTVITGPNPVRALDRRPVRAYTDLLLHDMGNDLADICLGVAKPQEFRTEPLMGLSLRNTYLHDGRATTVEAAIAAHGGQASAARDRFNALSGRQRAELVRYLKTL